jgi:3-oxoacyl-[acyl-carrier-protein] synthase-3
MTIYAAITGCGMYVPERVLTNADLERMVDTSDEWIRVRTGIVERRVAGPSEHTSVIATRAAERALAAAGVSRSAVDLVVLATCTPDRPFPASACTVQAKLGLSNAAAFDLGAACSGFVYGLSVATSMIRGGLHRTVLLIGADVFTHLINWHDRNTCVLFGDGAGAVVLQATEQPLGLLSARLGSWGDGEHLMAAEAGGTRMPATAETIMQGKQYVYMNGREIFKHAVRQMGDSAQQALADVRLSTDEVKLVIPHQANLRIIEATAKRLEVPMDRVFVNVDRYGNTSAGTIPIALCEAVDQGRLDPGDIVLLTAFGGGLTWGSAVVRWGSDL